MPGLRFVLPPALGFLGALIVASGAVVAQTPPADDPPVEGVTVDLPAPEGEIPALPGAEDDAEGVAAEDEVAVLQGLDKITARISTFEAPIDEIARFGSLQIVARTCRKTPPEEPPESAAFLEIVDVRPDSPAVAVFTGWMFASSPALSAMEHPVYDVWVIDCKKAATSESETSAQN